MGDGHFAGPEAAQLDATLEVIEPLIDARLQIGCGDDDPVLALEARGGSLSHLHWNFSSRR
jgi:hypothetical protein